MTKLRDPQLSEAWSGGEPFHVRGNVACPGAYHPFGTELFIGPRKFDEVRLGMLLQPSRGIRPVTAGGTESTVACRVFPLLGGFGGAAGAVGVLDADAEGVGLVGGQATHSA